MGTIAPTEPDPTTAPVLPPFPVPPRRVWATGATVSLLLGIVMSIGAAALLIGAGAVHVIDNDRREGDYLTTDPVDLSTDGFALTVEHIDLDGLSGDWLLGEARVRVTGVESDRPVFVGIASADDAAAYLADVEYSEVAEIGDSSPEYDDRSGGAPTLAPSVVDIWAAQASGTGTQLLEWTPSDGDWTVVVMNSDGSAAVDVTTDLGATVPLFETVQRWFLVIGLFAGALGAGLIASATIRTRRSHRSAEVG